MGNALLEGENRVGKKVWKRCDGLGNNFYQNWPGKWAEKLTVSLEWIKNSVKKVGKCIAKNLLDELVFKKHVSGWMGGWM